MKEVQIIWEGTVSGISTIEIEDNETIEDAIQKAKDNPEQAIDIEYYPEDWEVDEEATRLYNEEETVEDPQMWEGFVTKENDENPS
jgi:hypothetical protein